MAIDYSNGFGGLEELSKAQGSAIVALARKQTYNFYLQSKDLSARSVKLAGVKVDGRTLDALIRKGYLVKVATGEDTIRFRMASAVSRELGVLIADEG